MILTHVVAVVLNHIIQLLPGALCDLLMLVCLELWRQQVSFPSHGMPIIAASSLLTEGPLAAETDNDGNGSSVLESNSLEAEFAERIKSPSTASSSSSLSKPGKSKWVIDASENLKSTWEHRAWTYGCMGLLAVNLVGAASDIHDFNDATTALGALFAAYVLSDLGTAVYHWGVDNYGDKSTPMFGRQIAAFQGHHQRPWTITQRQFCNNVHQVFKPATAPAAALLAISPWLALSMHTFLPSFLLLVCMSQQFHAWSHMRKSELPAAIITLQDANILIGRKAHGAHHKPNFEGNYSIVSGWWNPLLDGIGFFRWLENVVYEAAGVEPRCWYPPDHDWAEQAQSQAQLGQ
eukprot:GHRR01002299.1.p1 GENE.GHRR01002299.1~~GHRR01002299.1.p1  ORF type:complete len:349 (+),score=120.99 GHRR01002299.1:1255-2301(+)